MNGACNVKLFLAPPTGALGRGQKVKYHLISITSQFQRFLYQTSCVFSQMKDTKHIQRDFHSVPWVMHATGVGLWGARGAKEIIFFFKHGHVVYQIGGADKQNRMQVKFSS